MQDNDINPVMNLDGHHCRSISTTRLWWFFGSFGGKFSGGSSRGRKKKRRWGVANLIWNEVCFCRLDFDVKAGRHHMGAIPTNKKGLLILIM